MNIFYGGATNYSNVGWYFDKIYNNEADMYNGTNDNILTGRMVLTQNNGLIWMRNGDDLDESNQTGYTQVGNSQTAQKIEVDENGIMRYIPVNNFYRNITGIVPESSNGTTTIRVYNINTLISLRITNNTDSNGTFRITSTVEESESFPTSNAYTITAGATVEIVGKQDLSLPAAPFKISFWSSSLSGLVYNCKYIQQGD